MTKTEQALKLVKRIGVVRPKDLAPHGIAPVYLRRLLKTGDLVQSARGLYKLAEHKETPHHRLAEASKLIPNGVVCLLSALHFHDLGKQPRAIRKDVQNLHHVAAVLATAQLRQPCGSDRPRDGPGSVHQPAGRRFHAGSPDPD